MEVYFEMQNSNQFARKIKSSCPMERQKLQLHKERKYEVNNYGVK